MRRVKMNVQGRIQGMGFRYVTKMVAGRLGVTGAVKNKDDGSVTIEIIGNDDIIQKFTEEAKKSPSPSGQVQYVDVQEDPMIEEWKKFDIVG